MNAERTESISQKADRLKRNYRVIQTGWSEGVVIGDHDTYTVAEVGSRWTCTCPWGRFKSHVKDCSHVVAFRRALQDPMSQEPVIRLADLITYAQRKGGKL